jgi:hypothetical protein
VGLNYKSDEEAILKYLFDLVTMFIEIEENTYKYTENYTYKYDQSYLVL